MVSSNPCGLGSPISIVVHSGADTRAEQAARTLAKFNFRRTRVLVGGFPAWRKTA